MLLGTRCVNLDVKQKVLVTNLVFVSKRVSDAAAPQTRLDFHR